MSIACMAALSLSQNQLSNSTPDSGDRALNLAKFVGWNFLQAERALILPPCPTVNAFLVKYMFARNPTTTLSIAQLFQADTASWFKARSLPAFYTSVGFDEFFIAGFQSPTIRKRKPLTSHDYI